MVEACAIDRIGGLFGVVADFFEVGGPSSDAVILLDDVRCVPGPGEFFKVVDRVWPGTANVECDIIAV